MMSNTIALLLLALTTAFAAPYLNDDYVEVVPQKRAALVLDRLLVALQKALRDDSPPRRYERLDRDGPRTAPLRFVDDDADMVPRRLLNSKTSSPVLAKPPSWRRAGKKLDRSSLERRGQSTNSRGRVLRCYFNAITCF